MPSFQKISKSGTDINDIVLLGKFFNFTFFTICYFSTKTYGGCKFSTIRALKASLPNPIIR